MWTKSTGLWTDERAPVHGGPIWIPLRGSNLEHPFWIRRLRKKEVGATAAVGSATELHGSGVTRESPQRWFSGRGLIERGLGWWGNDGEAIFGVGEARGGRGRARDDEERAMALGASGGEWGEVEELWWGADEVRDALRVLREAFIGVGVEGSGRGRRSTEWKSAVVRYQEEAGYGRGGWHGGGGGSKLRRRRRLGLWPEEGEEQLGLGWAERRKVGRLGCVAVTLPGLTREEFSTEMRRAAR
jgi:hypothetical protein